MIHCCLSNLFRSLSSSSPTHSPKEEYIGVYAKSEESGELVGNHTEQPQSLSGGIHARMTTKTQLFMFMLLFHIFISIAEDAVKSSATEPSPVPEHAGKEESSTWEEQLCAQQEQLEKEMQETRKMVTRLQVGLILIFRFEQIFCVVSEPPLIGPKSSQCKQK